MIKSVSITMRQWSSILNKIKQEYPPSVNLSREKMKRTLGFTPRFDLQESPSLCHLDFFSEKKKTFFLMKYSDIINNKKEIQDDTIF